MNEMVERVARAIAENDDPDVAPVTLEEMTPVWRETMLKAARAAIEVMREPTDDMLVAARRNNHPRDIDTWRTMIDAALEPK